MSGIGPGEAFKAWYTLTSAVGVALIGALGVLGVPGGVRLGLGLVLIGLGGFAGAGIRRRALFGPRGDLVAKMTRPVVRFTAFSVTMTVAGYVLFAVGFYELVFGLE